eukprot:3303926-Amphidinium_carterae.1
MPDDATSIFYRGWHAVRAGCLRLLTRGGPARSSLCEYPHPSLTILFSGSPKFDSKRKREKCCNSIARTECGIKRHRSLVQGIA